VAANDAADGAQADLGGTSTQAESRRSEEVASFFDSFGETFDRTYEAQSAGGRTLRRRLAVVLELVGRGPGELLDAGMGSGVVCAELERMGWTVTGVDISRRMVERARTRLPHLRERLLEGSIGALPFAPESFDAVVVVGVLEYVEDQLMPALREVGRVLRPGGTAVVTLPNYASIQTAARFRLLYPTVRVVKRVLGISAPPPRRTVAYKELKGAIEAAGLSVEQAELVGVRPLPTRIAERVERTGPRVLRLVATQYVVLARKHVS
jgi:ubiquinone/menaquinone biosynthesis C-methylase UbiE